MATLLVSIAFQLLASIRALKLIKLTGKSASWLLISGALLLMSVRRITALYSMLEYNLTINLFNEIIGLALSILMFLGISGIKSIFLERKQAEDAVKAMLAEKEIILKEVHHRLKNNMTTLISILHLQAGTLSDPAAVAALEEAGARVRSMMLLYEQLNKAGNFLEASARSYLSALIDGISASIAADRNVHIQKQLGDFTLDTRRLQTIGIIINELLTNCMKYAFPGKADGLLIISFLSEGDSLVLRVQDDGIGIAESIDFGHSSGLGLQLVHALAGQLDGSIRLERTKGTSIILEFAK
ncbi:MAG TPA: histidine kinase [Spirochaetaceae bacterium]|jgi:two-component sensor histidine kinase|nr:histidine kinase [Spirochaetaceae bacterium]